MNDYVKSVAEDQRSYIEEFIEDMKSFDITDDEILKIIKYILEGE